MGVGVDDRTNIVLIGMPGAGKSTCGVLLARLAGLGFVDTDLLIQAAEGRALQAIVDREGHLALRAIEERVILGLGARRQVIATGGSAVYSERAMAHLRRDGVTVFLHVALEAIARRVRDLPSRGIACRPGMSLADLYAERVPLYRRHADVTVETTGLDHEQVCRLVLGALARAGAEPAAPG